MDRVKLPSSQLSAWVFCCSLAMEKQFPPRVSAALVMLCRDRSRRQCLRRGSSAAHSSDTARCGLRQAGRHPLLCLRAAKWGEPHGPVLVEITAGASTAGNSSAVFC